MDELFRMPPIEPLIRIREVPVPSSRPFIGYDPRVDLLLKRIEEQAEEISSLRERIVILESKLGNEGEPCSA